MPTVLIAEQRTCAPPCMDEKILDRVTESINECWIQGLNEIILIIIIVIPRAWTLTLLSGGALCPQRGCSTGPAGPAPQRRRDDVARDEELVHVHTMSDAEAIKHVHLR